MADNGISIPKRQTYAIQVAFNITSHVSHMPFLIRRLAKLSVDEVSIS